MPALRQYAVLGPLLSGAETRAFLGCEVTDGVPRPDRPVVVVWLPDDVARDSKHVARLQRETAFVTQLRHPNILRVYGLECFEEGWARVVGFVDGEPLHRVTQKLREQGRRLEPRASARILLDACDAVSHAHEEGQSKYAGRPILHGGLRPDTLLLSFSGVTMVSGYGASALAPGQTADPHHDKFVYLAPEQIIGGKATASLSTDIYALGAMLYAFLSDLPPFSGSADVERAILTEEPPRIEAPPLAAALGTIALRAMSKRGADRFATVQAMRDAILQALPEEQIATHDELSSLINELIPPSAPERANRADLLSSALDPDTVTVLSRPAEAPEGIEVALFEAARPAPVSALIEVPSDPRAAVAAGTSRSPPTREAVTIVDGGPPISYMASDPGLSMPPAAHLPMAAPAPGNGAISTPPQNATVSRAPMQPINTPSPVPRAPMREESSITAFDKKAGDSSRGLLLVAVGLALALLIAIFAFPKEAPKGLDTPSERPVLPKEILQEILSKPGNQTSDEKPGEAAVEPGSQQDPATSGAALAGAHTESAPGQGETGAVAAEPVQRFGRLTLSTEPEVDVFDGNTNLGRTPLSTKLDIGPHQLRFTDSKTGINIYKRYQIRSAGEHKDHVSFGTSELTVEAPNGASVMLNSRFVGKAPLEPLTIYEGRYLLKVTFDGKNWTDWIEAPPGRKINYRVSMKDK